MLGMYWICIVLLFITNYMRGKWTTTSELYRHAAIRRGLIEMIVDADN